MTAVRDDLAAALRRAGLSHVDDDVRRRAEYSSDASNYRVVPRVVAYPRNVDEVWAAVAVAAELGVPITSRGGGTSTAGNAVGTGLVIDFSRHLNRVRALDPEARTAVVEPGAILDSITAAAAGFGLRYGPDPSTHARATIGGSIGNNACGARALRYGRTVDNVHDLDVLTVDGNRFTARRFGRDGLPADDPLLGGLARVTTEYLATIRTEFGRFTRQVSGYSLEHLLPENGADVARLLVGSEGTLGVVLGATVRLVEAPPAVALCVLGYVDMPSAADAVPGLLAHEAFGSGTASGVVALEGIDARLVEVVRTRRGAGAVPDLPRGGGWLFIETAGATRAEAIGVAEKLIADAGCLDSAIVVGAAAAALWRIREDGTGLAGRSPAGLPAWPGWEDAAVPPEHLGTYLRDFAELLRAHDLDALTYGHFGDGCVHARIDFAFERGSQAFLGFVSAAADLVASHGGSLSGEHGDGRARGALLSRMYSPDALAAFAQVKRLFDPTNLLNPGVLVDPAPVDADLRVPAARPLRRHLGFAFPHDRGDLSVAVHRCVGVGKCRADPIASGGVMCPSYLATRDEKDSTRGRARVLQELANGTLIDGVDSPAVAESLDLCLSCKGCSSDCPAGVDMATYKAEVLHQRYRHKRRPASHYALGWLPRWARLAGRAPRLANLPLRIPPLARLVKRLAGIDERRPIPTFAATGFRRWHRAHVVGAAQPSVLVWVDTFTEAFSPEVGKAALRVLADAGHHVGVIDARVCCGLTWISTGQLDGAKRQLRRTLDALDRATPDVPIVGLEPSCTAVLRRDIVELLPDDPRAVALAARVRTLAELLAETPGWVPPRLDGLDAVAQPHCHQHAVLGWDADAALLRDAGATVERLGGCCGLAGNFGVEKGHYEVSVAVAQTALLPAVRAAAPDTVVLADGFSCRTQLEQLSDRRGIHLAQLLAERLPTPALAPEPRDSPREPTQRGQE